MSENRKTCVITGINGQLGQFLSKYLHENEPDIQVIGTFRHKSYDCQPYIFDKSKVTFELMDLSDSHSIENLIIKYKPDYFINTAANAFVGESWAVPVQQLEQNCVGVLHQLESIRKHSSHTRYFNMGTSEEFACDINDGKLQDENTKIDPKSPYGCSKAGARYLVNVYRQSYNLYALQGWTFNFESELRGIKYVTKKITNGVARIYHAIRNNQPFEPIELGNLDSIRSWQFCGDVADGIWRMLNQEKYNKELDWSNVKSEIYHNYCDKHNIGHTDFGFDNKEQEIEHQKLYWKRYNNFLSSHIKNYVMSSSTCHTIREFIELAFKEANIELDNCNPEHISPANENPHLGRQVNYQTKDGRPVVVINPKFIRPLDVTYLNGDASKIKAELGWNSTLSFEQLVARMVKWDIENYKP